MKYMGNIQKDKEGGKMAEDLGKYITVLVSDDKMKADLFLSEVEDPTIYDVDSKTLRQKKISDIHNRVKIGNESQADIFVSIHLNKIPHDEYWGWQCFYKNGDENSLKLARNIQENLNSSIQKENKRVAMKLDTAYIMKHVEIPISIVECGFLSNQEEEKLLAVIGAFR